MGTRRQDLAAGSSSEAARSAAAWWLAAAWLPVLAARGAVLQAVDAAPGWLDVRGVASDTAGAVLVGTLALLLARLHGAAGAAWVFLWLLVCFGDAAHVVALGAHARIENAHYLGDPTFVLGSALHPVAPVLLGATAIATAWLVRRAMRASARRGPRPLFSLRGRRSTGPLPWLVGGWLLMAGGLAIWPLAAAAPDWRQASLVEANLRATGAQPPAPREPAVRDGRREPLDLSGTPRLAPLAGRPNVLLVLLEAISGAHVPAIAAANGVVADPALPALDRLAARHPTWTSFVAQQRQTNRGEYAILCGDWPRLRTGPPRMSEHVARGGGLRCLPERLRDLGYESVYLQAAPLAFMMKDQFMARIGFDTVLGNDWFPDARARTSWGVDDPTLFDGALREIDRLAQGGRPWLLTLLTVGTHHPYVVPPDFEAGGAEGFARAALQADAALGSFVEALAARGVLDDTVVLITSDESAGLGDGTGADPLTLLTSRSWGFLIALVPGAGPLRIDEPFVQSDLPASILDVVGAGEAAFAGLGGRSVFRRYDAPRSIAFANTYQRRIFVVDPPGTLDVCREDFSVCSRFAIPPGRPFAAGARPLRDLTPAERRERMAFVDGAGALRAQEPEGFEVGLLEDAVVPVLPGPARYQIVYGGQGWTVAAGSRIEVDVDLVLRGADGHATLRANLLAGDVDPPLHVVERRLAAGDRLRLRFAVETGRALHDVETRLVVTERDGDGLALAFERAALRVAPAPAVPPGQAPRLITDEQAPERAAGEQ